MAKNVREMSDSQLMELRRKMIENIKMVDKERQRRKDKTKEMKKSSFFSSLFTPSDDEERPAIGGRKKNIKKKIKKERRGSDEGKTRKIKATNEDMKYVLKKDGVSYSKRLKKSDLERLVRRHNLVGKAEKRCHKRKVKL
jgi:hypothetical protein